MEIAAHVSNFCHGRKDPCFSLQIFMCVLNKNIFVFLIDQAMNGEDVYFHSTKSQIYVKLLVT